MKRSDKNNETLKNKIKNDVLKKIVTEKPLSFEEIEKRWNILLKTIEEKSINDKNIKR